MCIRDRLYSTYALENPQALKIFGVADPDPIRRRKTAEMHVFGAVSYTHLWPAPLKCWAGFLCLHRV